jgi:protein FrlC
MRFAFSSNVFRPRPMEEAIENIAAAGFCGIELVADRPHAFPGDMTATSISALNQALEQYRIKVCNLNSSSVTVLEEPHNPSWIEEEWTQREMRIRYTLDCLRLAAAIGIGHVSTIGGGPIPESMNWNDGFRLFVANLNRVLPLAKRLGVKLLVEPHPEMLIENSVHVLAILKELEYHEQLGINFDAGHFFCVEEDPCEAWTKLSKYVGHVHLDDAPSDRSHQHLQLGEGALDIPRFLRHVEKSDYDGYISIRLDSYDQMADEVVIKSADYLRGKGFMEKRSEPCE